MFNWLFSAFFATGSWNSFAMLHHGMDHKYLATMEAKTGKHPFRILKCSHIYKHIWYMI